MEKFNERLIYLYGEWKEVDKYKLVNLFQKTTHMLKKYWSGETPPSTEVILAIKKDKPNVDLNWFFTGKGEPFLSDLNGNTTDEKVEVNTVESKTEAKSEVISEMEKIKAGMIDAFKKQLDDVAQAAMVGLEKLKGVASVRLLNLQKQFVNTQNLLLCK